MNRYQPRTRQAKPAFLKPREIRELARRLHTSEHNVAAVLQVVGHVLRERYRRRGWVAAKRGAGDVHDVGVERRAVQAAFGAVFDATESRGLDLPGPDAPTHKED